MSAFFIYFFYNNERDMLKLYPKIQDKKNGDIKRFFAQNKGFYIWKTLDTIPSKIW